jgi:hypothetical protein
MSRFKIVRNNTNSDRKLLQARIDTALVEDVNLLVKWSNRDKNEIIAELLRYALSQEVDFQLYRLSVRQQATTSMDSSAVRTLGKKTVEGERQSLPMAASGR